MTQPSNALKGKSLYEVYGYDKGYGDVIDAITKLVRAVLIERLPFTRRNLYKGGGESTPSPFLIRGI